MPDRCRKHKVPYTLFDDGLSACLVCVEADILRLRRSEYHGALLRTLPAEKLEDYKTLCNFHVGGDLEEYLRRKIVTASHKQQIPIVQMLARVCNGELGIVFPDLCAID